MKKQAKKSRAAKKPASKSIHSKALARKPSGKKSSAGKTAVVDTKRVLRKGPGRVRSASSRDLRGPDSAGQSGDLQGLSNRERADSESVDELIEEGNAFEAGVVAGVEEADDREGSEVHTHEVPEDDVPGEYLDEE